MVKKKDLGVFYNVLKFCFAYLENQRSAYILDDLQRNVVSKSFFSKTSNGVSFGLTKQMFKKNIAFLLVENKVRPTRKFILFPVA